MLFLNSKIHRYVLTAALLVCAPVFVRAQDLGSSNGLFNAPNPKTRAGKTPAKKAPVKKAAPAKNTMVAAVKKTIAKPKPKAAAAAQTAQQNTPKQNARKIAADTAKISKTLKSTAGAVKQTAAAVVPPPKTEPSEKLLASVGQPATATVKSNYDELFEQAIEEGNRARDRRDYVKAEGAYLRAQSLATTDSRAVYGLGNLYSDQQRWEEAERAYRAAIRLEPNSPEAYIALSFVLTQPIATENLADRYAEAEEAVRRAIAIDRTNAVAFDQLGVALELRGVIGDETKNAYAKAIKLEPNFALAYAHLGRLLRRKGLNNDSAVAYRSAIQYSTDVPTMILVADVMQSQQRYIESEQLLRQALRQDEKNPTALNLLGRALTTRGSFEEAERVLKKSADVSPNSFVSYSLLGSLFTRREKFDDAEKYLMKALRMVSANEKRRLAQDFETVGDGFARVGKKKDAARVYHQAVLLDQNKTGLTDKLAGAQRN